MGFGIVADSPRTHERRQVLSDRSRETKPDHSLNSAPAHRPNIREVENYRIVAGGLQEGERKLTV